MRVFLASVLLFLTLFIQAQDKKYAVVVHGGAGNFNSADFPEEVRNDYNTFFNNLMLYADSLASSGAFAIDIVEAVIVKMEDNPMFNSGKGAVLNAEGKAELDASIMDGRDLNAGAVAGVTEIKNPIKAARMVMDSSAHVMLSGEGANTFARQQGMEMVDNKYFLTQKMIDRYKEYMHDKHGTVGCVVLDIYGNLAAGTSTGGMMMKKWGRIGDSPVIGAGTYADNRYAAVSCTGHGEYFIRNAVAYDVIARMKYAGQSLEEAVNEIIMEVLVQQDANGGLISVDKNGNIVCKMNTTGMFRAWVTENHEIVIEF
ncbi:MAG: beta-aspartyl-peptidase [Marinilabiliales bacterium]|nr:MAG: beta-aspartyl-peptidase [Marinilabiliales bacterium]